MDQAPGLEGIDKNGVSVKIDANYIIEEDKMLVWRVLNLTKDVEYVTIKVPDNYKISYTEFFIPDSPNEKKKSNRPYFKDGDAPNLLTFISPTWLFPRDGFVYRLLPK